MWPGFVGRMHTNQCVRHLRMGSCSADPRLWGPRFFRRENHKSSKKGSVLGFGSVNLSKNRPDASGRYAVSPRPLQEWEQGRGRPESAVRAYLTVIDRNPEAVEKALMNKSWVAQALLPVHDAWNASIMAQAGVPVPREPEPATDGTR